MDTCPVTCPTCFEVFEITAPPPGEAPCEIDYDCEVCCRPMLVAFDDDGEGTVSARAQGLGE